MTKSLQIIMINIQYLICDNRTKNELTAQQKKSTPKVKIITMDMVIQEQISKRASKTMIEKMHYRLKLKYT
ncbi:MAG: hypothetical protein ACRCRU_05025 [Vibrio sp.]|uniref:hypothetical protein n=1 Tax=Vibrio sp. TaxID=678 RepID=UPI003F3B6D29